MIYTLLPPNDPRVLSSIADFDIERFKDEEKIELKEFQHSNIWWYQWNGYFPPILKLGRV